MMLTLALPLVSTAEAYERGSSGWLQKPGITLGGATAGAPPPGVYMFEQFFSYQSSVVGPGAPNVGGASTSVHVASPAAGFVFVPGWTFLGATYNAVLVQPVAMFDVGAPVNINPAGFHNTYIVPVELSWKLGDSGFFAKAGLGMFAPDGSISGPNGLGNAGNPWWTFQPEFIVSYLRDGWNLTANLSYEMNTRNSVTNYKSGDVLHAEFTATKRFDRWTIGPVGYYVGQVTNDSSSAFYNNAINVNRYDLWAAGLLVGYDFGPVSLTVWALDEFSARASGGTPVAPGLDSASITKGYSVFSQLNFRLWAPDEPPPARPLFHK
jgi:hypothetical protein